MTDEQKDHAENELFRFAADELWNDEDKRKWVAERYGIDSGNYWLFRVGLRQTVIDRTQWDDPDYWERFLEDVDDQMKFGPIMRRDRWFEWSGDEFDPFRNWVHRERKPELPIDERRKPFTRPQIKKWWDDWDQLPDQKKAQYVLQKPIE